MDAPVRVTMAGAGNAFGDGGMLQTCVHVQAAGGDGALLVDCGATALTGLKRLGLEPGDVSVVAVSHLHGDHFGGLPFLILDGQFTRRVRPLHLVGPPGLEERLGRAMEVLFPGSSSVSRRFEVRVHELAPGSSAQVEGVGVRAFEADHAAGAPALALRVRVAGRTIAYSGDTAWTDTLIDVADGADLFLCEGYTYERAVRYHLHVPELLARLDRLSCRRLLLTHAGPQVLARRAELGLDLAEDGMVLDV
ncbi:MBL fold metallo-hydrolase [Nonomuraea roseoviolacea]|uniref:Ribonuclease BN (tRNA processing enzyme) n=1 Tax=Nonomuraea roseoviolacea subsp. carminata TaxID=160689 RepID=A0ABT1K2P8_9ACTN|nr:MBL fold metallo-hydrolase [Nonomuraea roseoviolacea]MCP2348275.1 ribonuclease BN (tRNA processing enzyme) [Nonomuraea roseoviolacea subsp. carminata]